VSGKREREREVDAVRIVTRSNIVFAVMVMIAIAIGYSMRTGSAQPADYCSGTTHVTITADDARMVMHDPMCSKEVGGP
jgi:hypothetical protein